MTEFITHNSNEPPLLAPAALVEIIEDDRQHPLTDKQGHRYVSAEGLEPWAGWVATDRDGMAWQFAEKPGVDAGMWDDEGSVMVARAPATHRHPGDYRDSLYRVWREGRNPMTDNTPPPGSDDAVKQGCQCPVMDNCFGEGWMGDSTSYWIDEDCPLHGQEGETHD